MIEIMQSATGLTLTIGPFVSQADGKTPVEGVDLTTADSAIIFKHSAASASFSIDSATWTNMGSGYYSLAATSSMFDTLGPARIAINDVSIVLPYHLDVMVVHDNYWNAKYSTSPFMASASGGTIASCSYPVLIYGTSAGAISASSFAAGALATSAENASAVWYATVTAHAVTNSYGLILGGIPSATTQASVIAAIAGKAAYLPSASIASIVWNAASADYAVAGSFGGILGAMGAGADPWSSTVTNYTGTNTFGLILGGIPSATTLASVIAGIAGKTVYIPSATVENWTIASVSNSVHIGITDVGSVTGNLLGTIASVSSSVLIRAGQTIASVSNSVNFSTGTIASVSNSVWWTAIRDVGSVTGNLMLNVSGNVVGTVASVSSIAVHDVGTVSGGVLGNIIGTLSSVSAGAQIATQVAAIYGKLPTKYYLTGTNELDGDLEMASVVGVFPNDLTGTLSSVSSSVLTRGTTVASIVWSALSSSFGVGGTFGGILGAMGAGADPWSSTVTNYTGTNTFGLLLGGLPSTTTLASAVMAAVGKTAYIPSATVENWTIASVSNSVNFTAGTIASVSNFANWTIASVSGSIWQMASSIYGKTSYIPSATVEQWTIASVSNSVHIGVTDVGSVTGNLLGTVASVSSSVLIRAGQTIASVSNSVWWTAIRDVGTVTGSVASVSAIGIQTIASVSGSMYGMGIAVMGKTAYLPSMTVASWTIGLVGSVSASVVDGIFEEVVEGTTTFRESQKYQNAFAAGKASVAVGSATASFRDIADSLDRLIMDVDEDGNRTTVTRNGA